MTSELRPAVEVWTDPSPPNGFCPYDHCSAKAPFGTMRIEWKSWEDYPNYCLYFDAGETFIGSFDSLDRAKEHAAAVIEAYGNEREVRALAEQANQLEILQRSAKGWEEDALRYCQDAEHYKSLAETLAAALEKLKTAADETAYIMNTTIMDEAISFAEQALNQR